ncbi:RTC4-like domain-containing protein [Trichophaea hybrida]|nr:RTC4-like domain-containing protein [Trichophaea hybrida]
MAAIAGIKNIEAYRREINSSDSGEDKCRLCHCPLPDGYLEPWKDQSNNGIIRLEMWTRICQAHTRETLEDEWQKKGYPKPDWGTLASRTTKYLCVLKNIVANKVDSRFRDRFAQQQREIKGNTALLLRQERKLPFPGYYGPRGADILLDAIVSQLGSKVGDTAKKDPLIARGGVSAFIQQVLVPEVAIRLIAEDMKVSERAAFRILEESVEIGEKLNSTGERGDLYNDADGDNWVDVNATQRRQSRVNPDESWEEMDY